MLKQLGGSRAALLGVLFAMVAFSYALATSSGVSEKSTGATIRAVGSLTFTNPIISDSVGTDRDLGLAIAGSSFARYCRATGGVPPYRFAPATGTDGITLQNAFNSGTTMPLALSGLISGTLGTVPSPIRFGVKVTDSDAFGSGGLPNTHTETFRITLVTGTLFQFGNGPDLDDAIRGQFYSSKIGLVNGKTPLGAIKVANVTYNGTATANSALGDVGLAITTNGNISGVPIAVGTVAFDASCTDGSGTAARSRDGSTVGQHFVINVNDGPVASTIIASSITVKAGGSAGKDGVSYSGLLDLGSNKVGDLQGLAVQLQIGPYTAPLSPVFNDKGKASAKALKGVASTTATINSKGQLKITVKGDTITAALGTPMLVTVVIGNNVAAEVLPFVMKQSSRGNTFTYKFGVALPAGSFLITSVTGKDDKDSTGDAWKVSFIAKPAINQQFSGSEADVTIAGFTMPTTMSPSGKNGLKSGKAPSKTPNIVTKLSMEPVKGKGSLQTATLQATKTNIPVGANAGQAGAGAAFPMNITLIDVAKTTYQGEGTKQIIAAKKGWTSNIK